MLAHENSTRSLPNLPNVVRGNVPYEICNMLTSAIQNVVNGYSEYRKGKLTGVRKVHVDKLLLIKSMADPLEMLEALNQFYLSITNRFIEQFPWLDSYRLRTDLRQRIILNSIFTQQSIQRYINRENRLEILRLREAYSNEVYLHEVEKTTRETFELENESLKSGSAYRNLADRMETLESEIDKYQESETGLQQRVTDLHTAMNSIKQERDHITTLAGKLDERISSLQLEIQTQKEENQHLLHTIQQLQKEKQELSFELEMKNVRIRQLELELSRFNSPPEGIVPHSYPRQYAAVNVK